VNAGRFIWGLVLVGLGALFLAANLGWVGWSFALYLLQLWPLILVLIGIRLLLGRRSPTPAIVLMIVVLAAGVAIAAVGYNTGGRHGWNAAKTTTISGPATQGFTRAQATIDIGAANVEVTGQETGSMVQGTYSSRREPRITQSPAGGGSDAYSLVVGQANTGWVVIPFGSAREELKLRLTPSIPWALDVHTGAVDGTFDLTDVTLEALTLKAGASSLNVTVGPRIVPGAKVTIDGGAASFNLRLPRQLDITLSTSTGISSVNVDKGFSTPSGNTYTHKGGGDDLTVDIKGGVSAVDVQLY
jgi:Domain of unknown function (DUF5668)